MIDRRDACPTGKSDVTLGHGLQAVRGMPGFASGLFSCARCGVVLGLLSGRVIFGLDGGWGGAGPFVRSGWVGEAGKDGVE